MIVRYFVNMARGLQDVVDMASAIATHPRHRMSTEIGGQAVVACRIRLRRPSTSCQARYAAYFSRFTIFIVYTVKARKLAYYGHTMRRQGSCLEKKIMQGTMPGARRRWRPRTAWMDNIITWTGLSVDESIRMTENRDKLEKVRPWCGQPSHRGRLKNRTEQIVYTCNSWRSPPIPERYNQSGFYWSKDSEWQWHQLGHMQVCTSLQTDNHTSTQPLCILQARPPSQQRQSTEGIRRMCYITV